MWDTPEVPRNNYEHFLEESESLTLRKLGTILSGHQWALISTLWMEMPGVFPVTCDILQSSPKQLWGAGWWPAHLEALGTFADTLKVKFQCHFSILSLLFVCHSMTLLFFRDLIGFLLLSEIPLPKSLYSWLTLKSEVSQPWLSLLFLKKALMPLAGINLPTSFTPSSERMQCSLLQLFHVPLLHSEQKPDGSWLLK